MRKFTIKDSSAKRPRVARVIIEKSYKWHGFGSFIRGAHSEARCGDEYLVVCYTDVYLETPYQYEVKINRRKVEAYPLVQDNRGNALVWLHHRFTEVDLDCAAVKIDSIHRIITITTTTDAEVIEK